MQSPLPHTSYYIPHTRKGFTVIELVVSISLLLIIGSFAVVAIQNQVQSTLDSESQVIVARLTEAQSRAISGVNNLGWGVRFHNATNTTPYYALFSGASFQTSTQTYYLSGLIQFATPASGTLQDVVFTKLSGSTATNTTIVVRLKSDPTESKSITITNKGKISTQ